MSAYMSCPKCHQSETFDVDRFECYECKFNLYDVMDENEKLKQRCKDLESQDESFFKKDTVGYES